MSQRTPTDAELALLSILWRLGPSTVREVHRALQEEREVGYTTVLKMLQVMHEKHLVSRDTSQRSHVYAPAHSEERMQGHLVSTLADKAFGGSTSRLVLRALTEGPTDPVELAAIRSLLDSLEEDA